MTKPKSYGIAPYYKKNGKIYLFLCKASDSRTKWGFLKGTITSKEDPKECAKREFYEESNIPIKLEYFEEYFEQINIKKDVGVWLVDASKIKNFENYFDSNLKLKSKYRSKELTDAGLFEIYKMPPSKNNQFKIIFDIVYFLKHQKFGDSSEL
ncbi:MAG: NUDIX domain-containing protein [Arcobacter butzleri]|nr:NUDIX domain-containing protein [Arcobacteraceae bacterium]NLO17828.1 NUDIX domain-containing protein [Aliarcobacter butzleri]